MANISSFNSAGAVPDGIPRAKTTVKKELGLNDIKAPNPVKSANASIKGASGKLNTTTTSLNAIEAPKGNLNAVEAPKPKNLVDTKNVTKAAPAEAPKQTDLNVDNGQWIGNKNAPPEGIPTVTPTKKPSAAQPVDATKTPDGIPTSGPQGTAQIEATAGAAEAVGDEAANAARDSLKQVEDLKEAGLDAEEDLMQDSVELANNSYEQDMARYDQLKAQQDTILAQRNALEADSSDFQKQKIEQSYQDTLTQMEIQQERMDKAYQDQILSQKAANTKRTLQAENRIAALGGYGDLQKGKELQGLTLENDSLLNSIVFEKNMTNKEMSLQYKQLNDSYTNSIKEVELSKNKAVQGNYEQYLDYVSKITEAQDLSQQRKDELILGAKKEYTKQVAQINQTAFTQRYEISRDAAEEARVLKNEQKQDARVMLEDMLTTYAMSDKPLTDAQKKQISQLEAQAGLPTGYNMTKLEAIKSQAAAQDLEIKTEIDDYGNYNVVAINKSTGAIENFQTLEGIGKSNMEKSAFKLEFDPITGESILFDPATGAMQRMGAGASPAQVMGGYYSEGDSSFTPPAGTVPVGNNYVPDNVVNSVLKVGQAVGWCGVFASTISTGPKVGDNWTEKKTKIVKQSNPTAGNKLLIPMGVKSDKGYGHVATVLSYDANTGNVMVVESNKDGRQNRGEGNGVVTIGTYNINDLNKQYGSNWGFTNGELKPEIASKLSAAGTPVQKSGPDEASTTVARAYEAAGKTISDPKALAQAVATYKATGVLPSPKEAAKTAATKEIDKGFVSKLAERVNAGQITGQAAMQQLANSYPLAVRDQAISLYLDAIGTKSSNFLTKMLGDSPAVINALGSQVSLNKPAKAPAVKESAVDKFLNS